MSRKARQTVAATTISELPPAPRPHVPEILPPHPDVLQADYELAKRCVTGEVAAWEMLYSQCHYRLETTVRILLKHRSDDPNLVDQITADVWYSLVANDGELLSRYDPKRGARLITFMRTIARDLIGRHYRSERRRIDRETVASRDRPQHHAAELDQFDISLDEFLAALPPGERQFCGDHLMNSSDSSDDSSPSGLTRASVWQKTHRIYNKLRRLF